MPSTILARADALMQRRRQGGIDGEDVPVLTDAIDVDEDDIPVLLEAEGIAADEPPATTASAPEAVIDAPPLPEIDVAPPADAAPLAEADPSFDRALLDIVAHELARRVNDRLTAELPAIIEATVRDFLAEREMLDLIQPRD